MKPNLYFGGTTAPHFISKFLCRTMFAATLLFSSMLMAQDIEPPEITSGKTGMNLAENSGANQVVYNTVANDNIAVTSYELTGTDADKLSITTAGVDISALSQGIYLMKVRTSSTQKTVKLLKR